MLARILSAAVLGIDAYPVEVEVDISPGLPKYDTVGLPDAAVKESRERVRAAIVNTGFEFPAGRVTVNLSPADIRKEGSAFDLPIALGILRATGALRAGRMEEFLFLGELSLDGRVKPVKGALPMAALSRERGFPGMVLPAENGAEAAVMEGLRVFPVSTLPQVVGFLRGELEIEPGEHIAERFLSEGGLGELDFDEIKGQHHAKRALEVAAAGGHNLLMIGPPGAGKSMLAKRLPTVLPPLSLEEAIETSKVWSVLGLLDSGRALLSERPFRSPHHTISDAGLIGGGHIPMPGEVSLAHNGVLFLDELPEFKKNVLEVLRQPMEDGRVTIARAQASISFPARFMLAAAMNPCPCGYFADSQRPCSCTPSKIKNYRSRVSGPLLDRIDIQVEVPRVKWQELSEESRGESSAAVSGRVRRARAIQRERFKGTRIFCNAHMSGRQVKRYCQLDDASRRLLEMAVERLGLSARAYNRILKMARTIADLASEAQLSPAHVSEAIQYRSLDREIFF